MVTAVTVRGNFPEERFAVSVSVRPGGERDSCKVGGQRTLERLRPRRLRKLGRPFVPGLFHGAALFGAWPPRPRPKADGRQFGPRWATPPPGALVLCKLQPCDGAAAGAHIHSVGP